VRKLAFVCVAVTFTIVLGWSESGRQSPGTKSKAEFAGSCVKWILAAEPDFKRRGIDLDHYIVSVLEEKDSVTISLRAFDSRQNVRGSSGSFPAYEVEISKKDSKIVPPTMFANR
jgi:hypothetical protein